MESEKPHRSGLRRRSNNFLLCFSSRSSSSRLKLSSRSMLSPGRGREGSTVSLSSSLSRRLRSNGSMKGGQGQSSPMFPTGSKKKGSSFDTQEPSSPKVTCIGQVRVKTKKKNGRKMRTRSKRREVSFRKGEDGGEGLKDRNQRWVHLPLTICEALRGFGAEFNCFSPCGGRRSACSWSSSEREKSDKNRRRRRSTNSSLGSCGVVFARWLFAIDGEEKKEMHLEKEEEEERREKRDGVREMKEIEVEISEEDWREEMKVEAHKHDDEDEDEDEEARVSICIPPKNALLLMRCRSEPFRTSSLANRFWDSPAPKEENIDDEDEEEKEADRYKQRIFVEEEQVKVTVVQEEEEEVKKVKFEQTEAKMWVLAEESENPEKESLIEENSQELVEEKQETELAEEAEQQEEGQFEEEEIKVNDVSSDLKVEEGVEDEKRLSSSSFSTTVSIQAEAEAEAEAEEAVAEAEAEQVLGEETEEPNKSTEQEVVEEEDRSVSDEVKQMEGQEPVAGPEKLHSILPDCLLLMMCEPKLSMEVSKETWVCSTDFIRARHIPEAKADGEDEKKRLSTDGSKPAQRTHPAQSNKKPPLRPQKKSPQKVQPPRSSCSEVMGRASSPGPSMMASMIEKKLVNAVAYEPLVLTRCKSEPMRASAKLAPEACFWKNRKLEPHHAPTPGLGVGAAGVGF